MNLIFIIFVWAEKDRKGYGWSHREAKGGTNTWILVGGCLEAYGKGERLVN